MKRTNLFWALCGAVIIATGCSASSEDAVGDLSDSGASTGDDSDASGGGGGGGSLGGGNGGSGSTGNGGNGGSGGTTTDGGKSSSSNDAGSTTVTDAGSKSTDAGKTSSGGVPTTCTQAGGQVGCCDPTGVLYYCTSTSKLTKQACTGGNVCGWSSAGYYDCVAPPASADPSGTAPMACGGSGGGSTDAGTTTTDAGGGSTVTWTTIYNNVFGPSGTSGCSGSGCHTSSKSGFACGTTKTSCYNGFVSAGYITPGANASSSALVDPNQSPLCGTTLGGNMPIGNACPTSAQIAQIKSWLAAGAPNN